MTLNIPKATIKDSLGQLAKSASITAVAPAETVARSLFAPNGNVVSIDVGYAGITNFQTFKGLVEYADIAIDADSIIQNFDLSDLPKDYPHRQRFSKIWTPDPNDANQLNSTGVLADVAGKCGIRVTRNDLEGYSIVNSLEVSQVTLIDLASMLCAPFNHFDYLKYFIKMNSDGLQIIKADYRSTANNAFQISNIVEMHKHYESYMPDGGRIGNKQIVLIGGDILGKPTLDFSDLPEPVTLTVTQSYHSSSNDTSATDQGAYVEGWAERDTTVEYDLTVHFATDEDFGGLTLDSVISGLLDGTILDASIDASRTIREESRSYVGGYGLIEKEVTSYYFNTKTFTTNSILDTQSTSKVLTSDVTETYSYSPQEIPISRTVRRYGYTPSGFNYTVAILTYNWNRDAWGLNHVESQISPETGLTTLDMALQARGINSSGRYESEFTFNPNQDFSLHSPMDQYRTINGTPVLLTDLGAGGTFQNIQEKVADEVFSVPCPYMNYDGLGKVYALCHQQTVIEQTNLFWEITDITCSIEMAPSVGVGCNLSTALSVDNEPSTVIASGILEEIETTVDENRALTRMVLKRLVTSVG
jgi:hypothetical protein